MGVLLVLAIMVYVLSDRSPKRKIKKHEPLERLEVSQWEQDYSSGEIPKRVVTFFVPNDNFYKLFLLVLVFCLLLLWLNR